METRPTSCLATCGILWAFLAKLTEISGRHASYGYFVSVEYGNSTYRLSSNLRYPMGLPRKTDGDFGQEILDTDILRVQFRQAIILNPASLGA